ncbi:MAG: glycoside hydrolase family 3 protein [bacterium]|nr:glycoside hydrolase family 3 protein [bacterium]
MRININRNIFIVLLLVLLVAWFWWAYNNLDKPAIFCDEQTEICDQNTALYLDASRSVDERVEDLLARMTLEEKIGQLALIDRSNLSNSEDIARYNLGALLSGGGSLPEDRTAAGWQAMTAEYQSYTKKTRLKIPLLYGVDAIHGHANVLGATVFPHQIGLGATNDPDLVRRVYEATARELMATGVYWNFAPSLDVPKDQRWGRVYEAFSGDARRVDGLTASSIIGLQGEPSSPLVLATAKHYLGGGAAIWGSSDTEDYKIDQGDIELSEQLLRSEHLLPFQTAVEAGVGSVMVALNSWQGKKLSSHTYLLTDVLKGELGFTGFVVSDWYGVYEIPGNDYLNTVAAINSGVDMVMLPKDYKKFAADMLHAKQSGKISDSRLDDAVRRVLRAKFALGLFDREAPAPADLEVVGSDEHRAIAREAVRKSLVVLKDSRDILPLSKDVQTLLVAGSAADNVGQQCGGWTVEWQGIDGNWLPGATSILSGLKQTVSSKTEVIYERDGNFTLSDKADVGIAIIGEKPYAEGAGDNADPRLSTEDLAVIAKVRQSSDKLVVIIISGRALNIKTQARNWEAIVAAWLPGTEGQGVADVLFGGYPFTGALPVPWEL